jgi:hypothetical protein
VGHRSWILWPGDGDAPTRFFHAHGNSRQHRNHIHPLVNGDQALVAEEDKADVAFTFYDDPMGTPGIRSNTIRLDQLDLPRLDLWELSD